MQIKETLGGTRRLFCGIRSRRVLPVDLEKPVIACVLETLNRVSVGLLDLHARPDSPSNAFPSFIGAVRCCRRRPMRSFML